MMKNITQDHSYVNQYIDFYNKYSAECRADLPDEINFAREKALSILQSKGLPKRNEEDYKRFDVQSILEKDKGIKLSASNNEYNPYRSCRCHLGNITNLRFYMLDDEVYPSKELGEVYRELTGQGLFIGSIKKFAEQQPDVLAKYYGRIADMERNTLAALNTLLLRDAFVLYLPKGFKLEEPVQLIRLSGKYPDGLIFPRILVIAEEGASGSLLLCDHSLPEQETVSNAVSEVFVDKNASFTFYDLEETHEAHVRLENVHFRLNENAEAHYCPFTMTNGCTRNNVYADLDEEHANFEAQGFAVMDGEKKADTFIRVHHNVSNCQSNQLIKYTLDDTSVGSFTGRIYVAPDAQKTKAYQNNRNLNLSGKATMFSKPQLEIYADDVKCSHGLTIGQLDETALFYMRQRGIPELEAKMMLTIAFMSDVLNCINIEPLRDKLNDILESRYRGSAASCHHKSLLK